MAWIYPDEYFDDDDAIDWRDVMQNVHRMASEWNGMWDRDNVPESSATRGRIENNTFNVVDITYFYGAQTLAAGQTGAWTEVTGLTTTIDCDDGDVVVDAYVQTRWDEVGLEGVSSANMAEMRLLVDGVPVAESGWNGGARYEASLALVGASPVGAGSVRLSVEVRAYRMFSMYQQFIAQGFTEYQDFPETPFTPDHYITSTDLYLDHGALVYRHKKR